MHRQIDKERERERERERCVLFEFRHFFNSENSSTYFKVSCISLQKILIDEMSYIIRVNVKIRQILKEVKGKIRIT